MTTWLWILGGAYLLFLAFIAVGSRRKNKDAEDYVLAGSNVGLLLGLLTYAATLFSTFTLMGMPDFFRHHGVGAWIFLAVSDGAQIFLIVWFGIHLRRRARKLGFRGTAGLLSALYGNRWAGYTYFAGAFLFLVPYVAIQIRGLAIFLEAIFPGALPAWGWSSSIVVVMLLYSEVGGLRAIIASDALQGLTLLTVVWIIAIGCVSSFGGVESMFAQVGAVEEALLSTPGPEGLFTGQFLIASFFAILLLPATQPQLTTRLIIIRDTKTLHRMAVAIGCFAILIILPVVAIGMYGAVHYAEASTRDFLAGVLLFEQANVIAAAVVVGLLTAAMSTADSQIFALGIELGSLSKRQTRHVLPRTKLAVGAFGFAALIFSIVSSDQLVLLALVSFAGTSLLAPMVLAGVLLRHAPGFEVIVATALGLTVFLMSLAGLIPSQIGPVRLDLMLLITLALFTAASALYRNSRRRKAPIEERYV